MPRLQIPMIHSEEPLLQSKVKPVVRLSRNQCKLGLGGSQRKSATTRWRFRIVRWSSDWRATYTASNGSSKIVQGKSTFLSAWKTVGTLTLTKWATRLLHWISSNRTRSLLRWRPILFLLGKLALSSSSISKSRTQRGSMRLTYQVRSRTLSNPWHQLA